jgi:lantibiotic biosynthesis protein
VIAPERAQPRRAAASGAPAQKIPLEIIDELTLGRVPAWPAERARALMAAADWRERVASLLREDAEFRSAILIASAGLRPVVERVLRGEALDERAATRLLAYAVRMAARTTPFGAFASVGRVAFDAEREAHVDAASDRVVQANVDQEWLVGAVDALAERAIADGEDVDLVSATALRREGPRFALLDERKVFSDGDGFQYRSVTIAATPPVAHALELARGGCSSEALARALSEKFSVEHERARGLLRKLVDARFLIPAARPSPLDDACDRLAFYARAQPSLAPLVDAVRDTTRAHTGALDPAALGAAAEKLKPLGPESVAQPVFHDLTHAPLTLPERVREDALRLADALVRFSARDHLDAYRKRFYERYESTERLVPLLELVGPHGIGIPAQTELEKPQIPPLRRARLAALVGAALAEGRAEIVVSDAEWAAIRPDLPSTLPPTFEIAFHVLAPSFEAAAAGEYRIVSSSLIATHVAGMTTGRFAKYQPPAFSDALRALVAREAPPGAITAEPLFVPEQARSGNVIAHPVVAEAIIPVNAHAEGADAIALDDLLVGIGDDRVTLWSRSRGRRVQPVWPHAFNPNIAPPVARFFAWAARDNGRNPWPLDIGELAHLPFVPRIRLGRVVLRRATWTVPVAELRETPLATVARERRLARYVLIGEFDNVLPVDTSSEAGQTLLRDQTRGAKPDDVVTLTEASVGDDDLWLRDQSGARYCAEYVASVRSTGERKHGRHRPLFTGESARTRTPLSDWCYLKLYANDREFRSEIAPRLLAFAEEATASGLATHWFYLLYRDPDQHVRLRLHSAGDDAVLRERALAFADELARAGVVSRYALATYERELERYAGAEGIALCERLFHLDSAEALRGRAVDVLAGRERLEALAVPLLALLDALTTAPERERWVAERRPKAKPASREESEVLRVLASPPAAPAGDERAQLARAVAALCEDTDQWLGVVDSLLHMHLNRRGVAREEETSLRTLLWKALYARSRRVP